ncbi:DUF4296 domain-containing protein [Flavobacterium sp. N502536]|uniref:DUF4296 domain-containing protein n=1 Tax=Flavobacterium sp. N502536 TaxID=2986837 RepID=UPI0022232ED5|nr:DUF4296 domain-containing protein [Flavobacterium sp. N502536]
MKNFIVIVLVLCFSVSCKKELVKQPAKLIEKDKMIDIMYDLSLIEAMKYQHPVSVDSVETSPTAFILKKYKIDSLQFSQSNRYYAADYENYKSMFDEVGKRLAVNQRAVDSILKIEEKNAAKEKKNKLKDTLKDKIKRDLKKMRLDSIRKTTRLSR